MLAYRAVLMSVRRPIIVFPVYLTAVKPILGFSN